MVECTKLKATIPESTCIARQKQIKKTNGNGNGRNWGNRGSSWFKFDQCIGCESGLKLYKNRNKERAMEEKKCSKCGQLKPLDRFYKHPKTKDGRQPHCKKCHILIIQKKTPVKTIRCEKCDKEYPLGKGYLVPDPNSNLGFETICRECQIAALSIEKPKVDTANKQITLDFSNNPEAWEKVEEWSKSWMRPPETQIMYFLATRKLEKGLASS